MRKFLNALFKISDAKSTSSVFTEPVPSILGLPSEITIEILKFLDLKSIFSVRLVCRSLYGATKSSALWHDLVRLLQQRPGITRTEESLSDYTVEELERRMLHHYRVQQAWSPTGALKFRRRLLEVPNRCPVVLPGGRWLLSMDRRGRVFVTDLNAPEPIPNVLCQVEELIEGTEYVDRPSKFVVWMDSTADRLMCRIAVLNSLNFSALSPSPERNALTRIHIFKAYLKGHGSDAMLFSEPFKVVQGSFPGGSRCEVLDDRYFIQMKDCYRDPALLIGRYCVLNDFRYTHKDALPITIETTDDNFGFDVYLLPRERIATHTSEFISIYAIPSNEVTAPKLTLLHIIPVHAYLGYPFGVYRTAPRISADFATVLYLVRGDLVAVRIPHGSLEEATVLRLSTNEFGPFDGSGAVGFVNTVALDILFDATPDVTPWVNVIKCSWDVDSSDSQVGEANCVARGVPFPHVGLTVKVCGFDEAIGRIVMCNSASQVDCMEVYDTVY